MFLGIRAAARVMRPQGHGSIINTSSVAALQANAAGHDYPAKAAIAQLTVTAANELGEDGVRVNAICPGGIATSIFGRAAGLDAEAAQTDGGDHGGGAGRRGPHEALGPALGHRRVWRCGWPVTPPTS